MGRHVDERHTHGLALLWAGTSMGRYVHGPGGSGTVTPINTVTNVAGPPITVGESPIAIAIAP